MRGRRLGLGRLRTNATAAAATTIQELRKLTSKPINANFFLTPEPEDQSDGD
jgi:hypothetical protein